MKIAIISNLASWGGSEELWADAASEALAAGHQVGLWLYRYGGLPAKVTAMAQRGAQIFLRRPVPLGRFGAYVAPLLGSFRELPAYKPDVVLVNQPNTYSVVENADYRRVDRFLRETGTPHVIICHWNSDGQSILEAQRVAALEIFRRATRLAFVSVNNRASAMRQMADPLPGAIIVKNPVNLADHSELPWPAASSPARLANVARLDINYKGQDLLLHALSTPQWASRDWQVSFYGSGPDRGFLQRSAAQYGITDRARLAGHVADVRGLWSDNHLLVLPSRSEGLPLALVEAAICGRPAVVTDVGDNAVWVEDGVTGFVAEGATPRSIGAALDRAWSTRDRWPEMGAAARAAALRRIDATPGRSLLNLLVEAAADRKPRSGDRI